MQKINIVNLFKNLPEAGKTEQFENLLSVSGCRIERIVSQGQASPPGFWYRQDWDEWVLLLSGSAVLTLEDQPEPTPLQVGDCLLIPSHLRHRVESTDSQQPTVWLAVHFPAPSR
ncbi:cupin domain-containing protein [Candidatus Methylospira mobilis]|uniref:Cupin domain-containing protein n=1 Tax=Candidatus Methylospira mobilis TaxID=1808979 RepID=A0A5Q0BNA0_9GAMM|nr:cupin domain-containing protein [Candidatus Methylospira mobilis]QFY43588.1 cupin domain-containing protein [Candidatus Methylospira mobilis]WNV03870.1 cupin domain-containing protein [Candidatus Methylospira mobilis]